MPLPDTASFAPCGNGVMAFFAMCAIVSVSDGR